MFIELFYAVLFLCSLVFEHGFLYAAGIPFSFLPFHLILGTLILHRGSETVGALWFLLTALIAPMIGFTQFSAWGYIAIAIAGPLLTKQLFTNRSVYALLGLGLTLFMLLNAVTAIAGLTGFPQIEPHNVFAPWSFFFLMIGLYCGFVLSAYLERLLSRTFLIRSPRV